MRRKKSKWRGFFLFMVLYALLVVLATCVGMKYLWDFADKYEKARPSYKINDYVASLDEKHVKKISIPFVSSLDPSIQNEDVAYAEI